MSGADHPEGLGDDLRGASIVARAQQKQLDDVPQCIASIASVACDAETRADAFDPGGLSNLADGSSLTEHFEREQLYQAIPDTRESKT